MQADLGAVTGAQASIYSRAKVALYQSLPLLEGLTSLRVDILPEDQRVALTLQAQLALPIDRTVFSGHRCDQVYLSC